jgi:opacity protein-like surface antigen
MRTSHNASINRIVVSAFAFALAGSASAQDSTSINAGSAAPSELALRSSGSVSLIQTRPQGAFAKNIGFGYGVNGAYLLRLDRAGVLSIRADIGVVDYGNESERTALSETVGGRVQVNVRTTHYIVPMSVGPQLTWPVGYLRPYINAGLGGQAFFTESRVEQADGGSEIASTTNHSAFAAAWTTGAGVYVPLRTGAMKVQLDIGMQYVNGNRSQYLAPGSIADLPGGQIKISPLESSTHMMVVRLGARIEL